TWITLPALRAAVGADAVQQRPDDFEDYQLIRWRADADVAAAERRVARLAATKDYFALRSMLPTAVVDLGHLATMPLVLAVFFGLLACATVAHALVTTVRRRRYDLAVLRSVGFTRRQSRIAIPWQVTPLPVAGRGERGTRRGAGRARGRASARRRTGARGHPHSSGGDTQGRIAQPVTFDVWRRPLRWSA